MDKVNILLSECKMIPCIICEAALTSYTAYHDHNVNKHSMIELSNCIIRFQMFLDTVSPMLLLKHQKEANFLFKDLPMKETSRKDGCLQTDCMDEVIELGHNEGADMLSVQSLFLKSNLSPFSRQIIEVQESKRSQLGMRELTNDLNSAICHFDRNVLTTECSSDLPAQGSMDSIQQNKKNKTALLHNHEEDSILPPMTESTKPKRKILTTTSRRRKTLSDPKSCHKMNLVKETSISDSDKNVDKSSASLKVVLRSGRTIKTKQNDNDFIYFNGIKDRHSKNPSTQRKTANNMNSDGPKLKNSDAVHISCSSGRDKSHPRPNDNTNWMDILGSINLDDINITEEFDISIEDLDMQGFADFEGVLPENQILTVENLLEELEGGGSIEVSNVIKENNLESEMLVLNALTQNSGNNINLLDDDHSAVLAEATDDLSYLHKKENELNCFSNLLDKDLKTCLPCGKKYKTQSSLLHHMKKYHQATSWMKYKCLTCGRMFGFMSALERHTKEHNPDINYSCKVCGRQFRNLKTLKYHFALHIKSDKYNCPYCSKVYFLKYTYNRHLKTHFQNEKHHCATCDRSFTEKFSYLRHIKKHEVSKYLGQSKYVKCNKCGDTKHPSALSSELNCNAKLIVCLKCNRGIYKRFLLTNDTVSNDSLSNKRPEVRRKCHLCHKNVLNFDRHIRENHISNPYVKCNICNQSVKKNSLLSHKHRKHEGSPVSCNHCNNVFKNILSLQAHLVKVRKEQQSHS